MRRAAAASVRPSRTYARAVVRAVSVLLAVACSAGAHTLSPDDVIAEIAGPEGRAVGVVSVARDARVARVLVVKVGPAWARAPAVLRVQAVETWLAHWRQAVAQGVLGVVDDATAAVLVNFDARGRARLTTPPAPP
jgi:hypothetical protein